MIEHVDVYRVQRRDGSGPYRGDDSSLAAKDHARSWFADVHDDDNGLAHPGPYDDFRRAPLQRERCGFADLTQLAWWFNRRAREALARHGFSVTRYSVPRDKVTYGRAQVLFVEAWGDVVETFPITTIKGA